MASARLRSQLADLGYSVRAVDLGGTDGYDLADWCRDHPGDSLWICPDLPKDAPTPTPDDLLGQLEELATKDAVREWMYDPATLALVPTLPSDVRTRIVEVTLPNKGIAQTVIRRWVRHLRHRDGDTTPTILCTHPVTGVDLWLPPGYTLAAHGDETAIVKISAESADLVYPGLISVAETGVDVHTNEHTVTIRWDETEHTMPQASLTDGRDIGTALASRGAAIQVENRGKVAAWLTEFLVTNRDRLPHRTITTKLGVCRGAVTLPSGTIGSDEPIVYRGPHRITLGTDHDPTREPYARL